MRRRTRVALLAAATTALLAVPAHGSSPAGVFPVRGEVDYGSAENRFGNDRGGHVHEGQDVFAPAGTPLVAVRSGIVLEAGSDGGRGNYAYLYSPVADETYAYFHMLEPAAVAAGDRVAAGRRIGLLGCSGSCWGDHLHFEVHRGRDPYGAAIDPLPLLRALSAAQRWRWLDAGRSL